jgi:hypothetical protein
MARTGSRAAPQVVFDNRDNSLLDLVDNLLNKGVVLNGELTISLANVDLVYARLSVLLCAADFVLPSRKKESHPRRAVRTQARLPLARE